MSDPQRTIDCLDDQLGRDQARWTALLAALDALVRKMRADANTTEDAPIGLPWSHGVRVTARQYATELETILATHREGR